MRGLIGLCLVLRPAGCVAVLLAFGRSAAALYFFWTTHYLLLRRMYVTAGAASAFDTFLLTFSEAGGATSQILPYGGISTLNLPLDLCRILIVKSVRHFSL